MSWWPWQSGLKPGVRERKLKGKTDLGVDGEGAEEGEGTGMLVVSFDEPSPVLTSTV